MRNRGKHMFMFENPRDMLKVIFEAIFVDVAARRLVCVKPWPPFLPLFRMDGLEERDGCFYVQEKET
jgi:hypothetical protein